MHPAGMWNLPSNVPIPTTPVDQPYRVQLEAVPDRFQENTVWVHDQVVVGDRRIVRSAAGDGFWHVPDSPIPDDAITHAVFEAHSCASFICHVR
jgi:hypothetical protein